MQKDKKTDITESNEEVKVTKVIETRDLVSKVTFGVEQSIRLGDYESLKPSMYLAREYLTSEVNIELIEEQKTNAVNMFDGYKKELIEKELVRVQGIKDSEIQDSKTLVEDTIESLKTYIESKQSITLLTKVFKRLVKEYDDLVLISHKEAIQYSDEIISLKNLISKLEISKNPTSSVSVNVPNVPTKEVEPKQVKKLEPLRPQVQEKEKESIIEGGELKQVKKVNPIPVLEVINDEIKDLITEENLPVPEVKKIIKSELKEDIKEENVPLEIGSSGIFSLELKEEEQLVFSDDFINELMEIEKSEEIPEIKSNLFVENTKTTPTATLITPKITPKEKREVPEIKTEKPIAPVVTVDKKREEENRAEILLDDLPF